MISLKTNTGYSDGQAALARLRWAQRLQRKGKTFTEIALELGVPRSEIVRILYWDLVSA